MMIVQYCLLLVDSDWLCYNGFLLTNLHWKGVGFVQLLQMMHSLSVFKMVGMDGSTGGPGGPSSPRDLKRLNF